MCRASTAVRRLAPEGVGEGVKVQGLRKEEAGLEKLKVPISEGETGRMRV